MILTRGTKAVNEFPNDSGFILDIAYSYVYILGAGLGP